MNETKIYQASEFTDAYVIDTIKEVAAVTLTLTKATISLWVQGIFSFFGSNFNAL